MDSITIGQFIGILTAIVAGLVAFIKGVEFLWQKAGSAAAKWLQKGLAPTNAKIDELDRKISDAELEDCKTILVNFIGNIKRGVELTETEKERLHETYARYTKAGGNSYVHTEMEKLKKDGKL